MESESDQQLTEQDSESFVNVELEMAKSVEVSLNFQATEPSPAAGERAEEDDGEGVVEEEEEEDDDDDDEDEDSGTDHFPTEGSGTRLQRAERPGARGALPDTFQTSHLLYYERFKAYQDYMLGDCKTSEVRAFTADYLEKVVEPCDWLALWSTEVFDVLLEVKDVHYKTMKASVSLVLPLQCEARGCELDGEAMGALLDATHHQVALQDLWVVYEESGDFDHTALALEHLRFFYQHIWRDWDEEDEDDDFDYFVRCVEPRLRLHYDVLEGRVPAGLVTEYGCLLQRCRRCFRDFSALRSALSSDSDAELDNVSMVEGLQLYDHMEALKRKLRIIENPLLRYVLGYKGNARQQCVQAKGARASGGQIIHVVAASTTGSQLQALLSDKLLPLVAAGDDATIQFHPDPLQAVEACYEGDVVIVLPGHYIVTGALCLPDSVTVEGFGLPDDVVIEKKNKGDSFVETTGASVKLSNLKFIQHDAIEGILCVRQGQLQMENCVLQCETTGVVVRTAAQLTMSMCDLYGSKGAGVEIYPGSVCSLFGNGIHHCKEGILIKDFADQLDAAPRITMENNVIHNNEGYGVILVKPSTERHQDEIRDDHSTAKGLHADDATSPSSDITSPTPATTSPAPVNADSPQPEAEAGTPQSDLAASGRKWRLCRQLSRSREAGEAGSARPDLGLVQQDMFLSVQNNQFRRNGMGDFGTFLY